MRPIRLLGDPVLRTPAEPVTTFDAALRELVADLMDTTRGAPGRAAVAAPQIGVSARVFGYDLEGHSGHLVNPTIEVVGEEIQEDEEGCLSLPGLAFTTPRAMHVRAHGVDQHGEPLTVEATGFLARCMLHETDHLDGRLYVDRLTGATRRQALRAVRAAPWAAPTR
jgi:peptide deformylase